MLHPRQLRVLLAEPLGPQVSQRLLDFREAIPHGKDDPAIPLRQLGSLIIFISPIGPNETIRRRRRGMNESQRNGFRSADWDASGGEALAKGLGEDGG